jgi:predicted nucleic acid-binding protein
MILVDSSVWIDHLRGATADLARALEHGRVLAHPFVIGELALGSLRQREMVLRFLRDLPQAVMAEDAEILDFIDRHALFGLGIGYIGVHLLASARLTPDASLWTRDRRLQDAALRMGLAASEAGQ